MAFSQRLDTRPRPSRAELRLAWRIRGRRLADQFAFFLAIVGYDPDEKSWDSWLYLIYLVVFFGFIGLGVLAYFADLASRPLQRIGIADPYDAALAVAIAAMVGWVLWKLYRFGRTSPLVFTDNDAHLLAQTPVDRRAVILPWLFAEWLLPTALWASAAVILAFAVQDIVAADAPRFEFGPYLVAAARAVTVVLVLQLGLLLWLWTFGLLRVQGTRERPVHPFIAPVVAVLFAVGFLMGDGSVWSQLLSAPLQAVLAPIALPLQAAYGGAPWWSGMLLALGVTVVGAVALFSAGKRVNFGRCAQETRFEANQRAARWAGDFGYGRRVRAARRTGGSQPLATRLPVGHGVWALVWKDALQSERAFTWNAALQWVALAFLVAGFFLVPNVLATGILFIVWAQLMSRRATARLRDNLQNWWLWRQLPIPASRLLAASTLWPWLLGTTLTALPLAVVVWFGPFVPALFGLLVPTTVLVTVVSAEYALVRRARPEQLVNGIIPEPTDFAAFLSFVVVALSLVPVPFTQQSQGAALLGLGMAALIQAGGAWLIWTRAVAAYRKL